MAADDYYKILGVDRNVSKEEIKKAFHRLAHRYHPDKPGGDQEKFKKINEAYQVLVDDQKRSLYDKFGKAGIRSAAGVGGFEETVNFEDLFGGLGGFTDIFENFFPESFGHRVKKHRGQSLTVDLMITLEDVAKGATKVITLEKFVACSACRGSGAEPHSKMIACQNCKGKGKVTTIHATFLGSFSQTIPCEVCQGRGALPEKMCTSCAGRGRAKKTVSFTIEISQGVENGEIVKIAGEGDAAEQGGEPGDLFIRVYVKPHHKFKRDGANLKSEVTLNLFDIILGSELTFENLEGKKLLIKIPAGSQPGEVLRIGNQGLPRPYGRSKGDLFLKLKARPIKLTNETKKLIEELKRKLE